MDKKSKILLIIFILLIIISTSVSFYRYIYLEDITFFTDSESVPDSFDMVKKFLNYD